MYKKCANRVVNMCPCITVSGINAINDCKTINFPKIVIIRKIICNFACRCQYVAGVVFFMKAGAGRFMVTYG